MENERPWTIAGNVVDEKYRCIRPRRDGKRCWNPAVRGTTLCVFHGGRNFYLVTGGDRQRLEEAVNEHLRAQGYDV